MSMNERLLLRTVGGSHLYGLANERSDMDFFEVYTGKRRMKQSISAGVDTTRVSLNQFLKGLSNGTPQYVEALWSNQKDYCDLDWLVTGWRPGYATMWSTYLRTIKGFWLTGSEDWDSYRSFKLRRHAWRLHFNLRDYLRCGRFDPTLDSMAVDDVNYYAQHGQMPELYARPRRRYEPRRQGRI